jgi:hypothetical protein
MKAPTPLMATDSEFAKLTDFLMPYLHRVLAAVFLLIGISASAIVFFYPLEIETRESTVAPCPSVEGWN